MSIGGDNYFQRALVFQGGGALGAYEAVLINKSIGKRKGKAWMEDCLI